MIIRITYPNLFKGSVSFVYSSWIIYEFCTIMHVYAWSMRGLRNPNSGKIISCSQNHPNMPSKSRFWPSARKVLLLAGAWKRKRWKFPWLTVTLALDIAWSPSYERLSDCINKNSFPECFIVLFGYFLVVPKVRVFIQTFSLAKSRSTNSSNFRESSEP